MKGRRMRNGLRKWTAALLLLATCSSGGSRAPDWSYSTFKLRFWHGLCSMTRPLVRDGVLYFGGGPQAAHATHVYAVGLGTMELLWKFKTGSYFPAANIAATDTALYVVSGDWLYALDRKKGSLLWRHPASASSVVEDEGIVFLNGTTSLLEAIDGSSGSDLWQVRPRNMSFAPVVLGDSLFYVDDGSLLEVSKRSGVRLADYPQFDKVSRLTRVGDRLYFATKGEEPSAKWTGVVFDPATRESKMLGREFLSYKDGTLYFIVAEGIVEAVDVTTGRRLWISDKLPTLRRGGFAFRGDTMYQPALDGTARLNALDRTTGKRQWTFLAHPVDAYFEEPVVSGNALFVTGETCNLDMFKLP